MSRLVCLQCGTAYGTTTSAGDSHGLCGQSCASEYRAWAGSAMFATAPALWKPDGFEWAEPMRALRAPR